MPEKVDAVTFGEFAVEWLATVAAVRLKKSGYVEYESIVRVHLLPAFRELSLDNLSAQRIQSYVAANVSAGLAPRSVKNHAIVLRAILDVAVSYGLLVENPVDSVAMPRIERTEMSFLTPGQLHRLIEATPTSWRLLISLPALCGLRKSCVLALEWSDFDMDAMTVSITKSLRGGMVTSTKTSSSVSAVPLPESLLHSIEQRRTATNGGGLVFCKSDGSPLCDSTPNRVLARALAHAGLPSIRFHDLRHSWAVAHLKAGTDVKTLAALGRWSSTATLLETYAHVIPSIGGDAVRRLDRLVNEQDS